jgi:hypothetical protein
VRSLPNHTNPVQNASNILPEFFLIFGQIGKISLDISFLIVYDECGIRQRSFAKGTFVKGASPVLNAADECLAKLYKSRSVNFGGPTR